MLNGEPGSTDPAHVRAVGIRPNSSILAILSHLNYKAWFAVAEFVDNALQSYFSNREALRGLHGDDFKLKIRIWLDQTNSVIEVSDNAAGIAAQDFSRAFRAAEVPEDRSGLSEFGMGMKTAACWFTHTWSVRTKAIGDPLERLIRFNLKHIARANLEEVPVSEASAPVGAHYTVVRLEELGKKFPQTRTHRKLRDHLASIYRIYLRSTEVEIYFDDEEEPLQYREPEVLFAPPYSTPNALPVSWRKEINFEFAGGGRVTGFAGLRQEGSTTHAGFSLFRRNRLIVGSDDETYRPQEVFGNANSYRYQRLFGELHIDGFGVSHTKDGFRWDEHEEAFLERLRDHLRCEPLDLLKQADNYRARPSKTALQPVLKRAAATMAVDLQRAAGEALSIRGAGDGVVQITSSPPPALAAVASETVFELLVEGQRWNVLVRASVDPAVTEWLRIGKATRRQLVGFETNDLTIDVSMAHPFVQAYIGSRNENAALFLRLGVALALATEKSSRAGYPMLLGLHWMNRLLREALPEDGE